MFVILSVASLAKGRGTALAVEGFCEISHKFSSLDYFNIQSNPLTIILFPNLYKIFLFLEKHSQILTFPKLLSLLNLYIKTIDLLG